MSNRLIPRVGLRSEVVIVFPVAVLLLVLIATFSVFAYREALERIGEERRAGALRLARRVAELLDRQPPLEAMALRSLALDAESLAVYGPDGRLLVHLGGRTVPPAAISTSPPVAGASGPSPESPNRVVAIAPTGSGVVKNAVRVEVEAGAIWTAEVSLRILLPVVLVLGGGLVILVVVFLGRLLAPYDRLIVQARQAGLLEPGDSDEIASLMNGFEQAIAASRLADAGSTASTDLVGAVERALGSELEAGLLLLDPHGQVLGLNPEGARLLGIEAQPSGLSATRLLEPLPEIAGPIGAAVAAGRAIERTEVALRRRGETMTLGLALHPLRRRDGTPRGFLALFSDLTRFERLAAERRMAEGLAQLGELSAGVAHELRNSLGVLRGYLDLLREEADASVGAEYHRELLNETLRLQGVVDDFLTFARPGGSRLELVDLAAIVARVAADPALSGCGARISMPSAPPPPLRGDPVLLERAVRNLTRNAAAAHPGEAAAEPLRLAIERTADGWAVLVEDRGPGLPAEVRARLFQPFVSGRRGGTGLGLALTFRIVNLHSGTLEIQDREGGGTCARISFRNDVFVTEGHATVPTGAAPTSGTESQV